LPPSKNKENVALTQKNIKRKETQTDRQHANRESLTSNDTSLSLNYEELKKKDDRFLN